MAEEKKERWLNWLALTTVILAVCATMATFKGGGFSSRSLLSQTQASDQWAFYQSKSIKAYLFDMQKEQLEMQAKSCAVGNPALAEECRQKAAAYREKLGKYEAEKAQILKEAKRLESVRDEAMRHGQVFGIAVIFLQVAILLCSIAGLLKKRYLWGAGVAIGCYGILQFANGFFLFL